VHTILLDENLTGFVAYLRGIAQSETWREFADYLSLQFINLPGAGLKTGISDLDLWNYCQTHGCYLLTENRNEDGRDSLETTLRNVARSKVCQYSQSATSTVFGKIRIM
jgi:hypothetical protein